jgi:hypothetical protein
MSVLLCTYVRPSLHQCPSFCVVQSLRFSLRADDDGWAMDRERLSSEGIRPLCNLRLTGLRELALSSQAIGPEGAIRIASFLAAGGAPLELLDLSLNRWVLCTRTSAVLVLYSHWTCRSIGGYCVLVLVLYSYYTHTGPVAQ